MTLFLYALLFALTFVLAAIFAGLETGLVSIDQLRLENEARHNRRLQPVLRFVQNPDRIFGLTLTGTNICHVILSTLFTVFILRALLGNVDEDTRQLATLGLSGVILVFAEIIPKMLFRDYPYSMVTRTFGFTRSAAAVLRPIISIFNRYNAWLARVLKVENVPLTREDLAYILEQSKSENKIQQHQKEMLEDALEFRDLRARNVMIPRTEIVAVEADTPLDEVIELARAEGYTRFPIYSDNLDQIIGILIIYDLIDRDPKKRTARDYAREVLFVPEAMDVFALLREMQAQRKSMVIVVDSYGGTSGLLTVEDILEEIVGEIEDEYDTEEEREVEKVNDDTYLVNGFVEVDELNDEYEMDLPHEDDYETLAGLIIHRLARIPAMGQKLRVGDWDLEVLQVTRRKIQRVKLTRTAR